MPGIEGMKPNNLIVIFNDNKPQLRQGFFIQYLLLTFFFKCLAKDFLAKYFLIFEFTL